MFDPADLEDGERAHGNVSSALASTHVASGLVVVFSPESKVGRQAGYRVGVAYPQTLDVTAFILR